MTAARTEATTTRRGAASPLAHPAMAGRVVLWVVVGINVAIVETLYFTSDPAVKNTLIGIAKFFGINAAMLMILQIVLIARVPWLDRRIGMDRLTAWHRWVGFGLFWAIVLHPTFILVGYSRFDKLPILREFTNFAGVLATLMGMIAAGIIIVAVALSIRFARRRLGYETWHAIHVLLYGAITLAIIHQLLEPTSFKTSTAATVYWWMVWGFAIGALLVGRIITPLWTNMRHKLRVVAVVPESDNVTSIYMQGRDLDRLDAQPGQFFIWRFLSKDLWWQANPFSLSAAPDGRTLRLTAKAVGRTSKALRHVPVGTRVYVEGPYGAFTSFHRAKEATLLIAGGVGVTPIRALLEELPAPVTVLYRVRDTADAVLLRELADLARARGAQLHVLTGRTGAGNPPNDPFGPQSLMALVPDIKERDVFVCGPSPMTTAVLRNLKALGMPRQQVHAERFSLAGTSVRK
jgi:predicted ferric reductase